MKNKRVLLFMVSLLVFVILISGCSASKSIESEIAPSSLPRGVDSGVSVNDTVRESKSSNEYLSIGVEPEKVITTVSVSMQTKEFMNTTEKLNSLISKYKGYVENSNISYNNYINSTGLKYSNYTIRIPKEGLTQFVDELKDIGNIISENTSKTDITKQYRDTKSRLKVLETKEERILTLLKKAEKMEDIIALENQLSNIIYEKENLTANIMDMDDKVDYSTVYVTLEEVAKLTSGETVKTPFFTKLTNAIKNSMYYFARDIGNFIIGLVYFLPYALIIGVMVYVVLKLLKFKRNRFPKNKEPKE